MNGYTAPSFQDRAAASGAAKRKLLEAMKAAPRPDAATLAERAERSAKREAAAQDDARPRRTARDAAPARPATALQNRSPAGR